MERSKYFIVFLLLFITFGSLNAIGKVDIYSAYISGNMQNWKKAMDEIDLQSGKSNESILELVNYQYGYIAYCIGIDNDDLAEEYLEKADKSLAILESAGSNLSMVNAYKSAFYGFRIGLSPYKAPFFGPKSVDCANLAIKQNKENPYGYLQYGNAQYYMPAMFGGSKLVALEYFLKAEKLMEFNAGQLKDDWNYLSLLTIIAKAYTEVGNLVAAKSYYDKILTIEPNFLWVKNNLYPELLKKIK